MTGDKACDHIAKIAIVADIAEIVHRILVAPRLHRKHLATERRFDKFDCGLLLTGIVSPDMYPVACKMPPSVSFDAFPIAATAAAHGRKVHATAHAIRDYVHVTIY